MRTSTFTYWDGIAQLHDRKAVRGRHRQHRAALATKPIRDWVREELSRYQAAHPCEACGGYRLKPQALAVKIGGKHIGEVGDLSIKAANIWFEEIPQDLHQAADRDRHAHPEGNPRPPEVLERRRPGISDAVALLGHAVGRRKPAHPPRLADRLGADRRALRAGRALHRSASARQRPPARNAQTSARHRQHRHRRRARRGRDHDRRSCRRHRPGRRHPRRRNHRARHAAGHHRQPQIASPANISPAAARSPIPRKRRARDRRKAADRHRRALQQPAERHGLDPGRPVHLHHRRLGRRQIHAPDRHAVQGRGAQAQQRQGSSGRARQDHRHRELRQGHRHRPVADRAHAALEPGDLHRRLHADPRMVRGPARGQDARLRARPLLLQRQGRALRERARATASSRSRCTSCPTST